MKYLSTNSNGCDWVSNVFCLSKFFKPCYLKVIKKTTNIVGYFFQMLQFQAKYLIANKNPAKYAFCEKISALQKFLPQMNILLLLSRKR